MSSRLNQLYAIMDQYGTCLEEETTRLKENRFSDIRDIYARKVQINEHYTRLAQQMMQNKEFKRLLPEEKERIRAQTLRLQSQLHENEALVKAAEESYDTIMNILLEAIRINQTLGCIYTPQGQVATSPALSTAFAINQEL